MSWGAGKGRGKKTGDRKREASRRGGVCLFPTGTAKYLKSKRMYGTVKKGGLGKLSQQKGMS